jgi:hypothetical protein
MCSASSPSLVSVVHFLHHSRRWYEKWHFPSFLKHLFSLSLGIVCNGEIGAYRQYLFKSRWIVSVHASKGHLQEPQWTTCGVLYLVQCFFMWQKFAILWKIFSKLKKPQIKDLLWWDLTLLCKHSAPFFFSTIISQTTFYCFHINIWEPLAKISYKKTHGSLGGG